MIVHSSAQIRVIRAFLGMDCKSFSARLGVCPATLTNWERSRSTPGPEKRQVLAELCQEHGIGYLPSGMPVPFAECFTFKPGEFTGWDPSVSPKAECMRVPDGDDSIALPGGCEGSCDSNNGNQPPSPRQDKRPGRPAGRKNRSRRDELLRRLNVDAEALAAQPQIAPLFKQRGILPSRVIEVLRADENGASQVVVALWDALTRANQNFLGLEGLSMAAGLTPRRLWELYSGASLMQGLAKAGRLEQLKK